MAVSMAIAMRWYYRVHHPMEDVQGFHKSH